MKYRIKKVTYGNGIIVYLPQYRNREFDDEIKTMLEYCILIIPIIFVIPAMLFRLFVWETIEECEDEALAQQYICDEKLKRQFRKDADCRKMLSKKKIQSDIIPLKKCDHENRS